MAASYKQTFTHTAAQATFDQNRAAKYHQTSYELLCFSHNMNQSLLLSLYTNSMSSFAINALFCYKIRFLRSAIKFTYIDQSWVASSMITMILFLACTITRARISIFATELPPPRTQSSRLMGPDRNTKIEVQTCQFSLHLNSLYIHKYTSKTVPLLLNLGTISISPTATTIFTYSELGARIHSPHTLKFQNLV